MKKNTALQIIALALAFILIAGVIAGVIFWQNGNISFTPVGQEQTEMSDEETPNEETPVPPIEATISDNEHIRLAMSAAVTAADTNSVSYTLTATVLPSTASNKAVDWSVAWGDESNETDVTDYVTVTPSSDGSTTATVTCYQPFTGDIVVTVVTRESGYLATCVVSFVGVPSSIDIKSSSGESVGSSVTLGVGGDFVFDVAATNVFNSVGEDYNDFNVEVIGVGSIIVANCTVYSSGTESWGSDVTKTLEELKGSFVTASFSDGKLTVSTIRTIESYYGTYRKIDGGRSDYYTNRYKSSVGECYFNIRVTEMYSGLSKTFKIVFDENAVTGVSLGKTEIVF